MRPRILAWALSLLAGGAAGSAGAPAELAPAVPIERSIAAGEVHAWRLALAPGELVRLVLDQRGIDLALRALSPTGAVLAEADGPSGESGREILTLIAETAGSHTVQVRAPGTAPPGGYRLEIAERHPAEARDRRRVEAERIEQTADAARARGTEDGLRRALQGYRDAASRRRELAEARQEAVDLLGAGSVARLLGRAAEAQADLAASLALRRDAGDGHGQAETLNQIGLAHWAQGEGGAARAAYSAAIDLWRAAGEPAEEARTLNNLGLVEQAGDPRRALELFRRAGELFHDAGDRRREAIAANNVGGVYDRMGEPLAALEHYGRALGLARQLGDRRREAAVLNNLAGIHALLGETQEAIGRYTEALSRFAEAGDRAGEAAALNNLAELYLGLGSPDRARILLRKALQPARGGGDRRATGAMLGNLGLSLQALGSVAGARRAFLGALAEQRAAGDRPGEAATVAALGLLETGRGRPREGQALLGRSLALRRELVDPVGEAKVLHQLGRLLRARRQPEAAIAALTEALALRRALGARAGEAATRWEMARAELARGDEDRALIQAEAAIELAEALRSGLADDELRLSYAASIQEVYDLAVRLLLRRHRRQPDGGHQVAALEMAERARARGLLDLLREARVAPHRGADPALVAREEALRRRLAAKEERRSRLLAGRHTAPEEEAAARELDELLEEQRQVRAQIRARSPRYARLTEPPAPVGLAEIQRHYLDGETLLLEFALGREQSAVWAVTPTSVEAFALPAREKVEASVRQAYSRASVAAPAERTRQQAALAALGRLLLGPVAHRLGARRLVIVPDGALHYVPFAALPSPRPGKGGGATPLVERHEIVLLPSAAALPALREPAAAHPPAAGRSLAVLADPVFTADDPRVAGGPAGREGRGPAVRRPRRSRTLRPPPLEPPRGGGDRRAAGPRAARLLARLPRRPRPGDRRRARPLPVVHFATHGGLDSRRPALSGLVLSRLDAAGRPRTASCACRTSTTSTSGRPGGALRLPHRPRPRDAAARGWSASPAASSTPAPAGCWRASGRSRTAPPPS